MTARPRWRVLALVPYPLDTAPGQRFRIEQWAPYLREEGIEVIFETFATETLSRALYRPGQFTFKAWHMTKAWVRRARLTWRTADFDAVFLYREAALIGPAWLERMTRLRNPRLVYDFDDAIWLPYVSPRNRYLSYLKAPGKTGAICRMAAAVTVGSEALADFARQHNPGVTVIPTTVSLREYRPRPDPRAAGELVVGWTGSHSSAQYLRIVEGALQTLSRRKRFRLLVNGVDDYHIEGVAVECRPWKAETEVEDLWPMDVGIMPLFDDPWARGKCALKAIQYMALSLPTVVSPVGANRDVVDHGVSGFHAESEQEWVQSLERLLDDADLRRRMGMEGRKRVERQYSAEVQAPRVGEVLRRLKP